MPACAVGGLRREGWRLWCGAGVGWFAGRHLPVMWGSEVIRAQARGLFRLARGEHWSELSRSSNYVQCCMFADQHLCSVCAPGRTVDQTLRNQAQRRGMKTSAVLQLQRDWGCMQPTSQHVRPLPVYMVHLYVRYAAHKCQRSAQRTSRNARSPPCMYDGWTYAVPCTSTPPPPADLLP